MEKNPTTEHLQEIENAKRALLESIKEDCPGITIKEVAYTEINESSVWVFYFTAQDETSLTDFRDLLIEDGGYYRAIPTGLPNTYYATYIIG